MNVRHFALAAATLVVTSAAFAAEPKPTAAEPQREARAQTALQDLAAGMREVLRSVAPEISLPALELKLPALDRAR